MLFAAITLKSVPRLTLRSIRGQSKSIEDTEHLLKSFLPTNEGEERSYRVVYAVHKCIAPGSGSVEGEPQSADTRNMPTESIGLLTLKSLDSSSLPLPENLTVPAAAAATTLTLELSYMFLPTAWGRGFAAESLSAVFAACKNTPSLWEPFTKLYVRAVVNDENPPSMRVMDKTGVAKRGIYVWTGDAVFLGGEWRQRSVLHIYGKYLIE